MASDLGREVSRYVRRGWRVEAATDTWATLVKGRRMGGGEASVHLVITVLTVGLWLPVWMLAGALSREKRVTLTVTPTGITRRRSRSR